MHEDRKATASREQHAQRCGDEEKAGHFQYCTELSVAGEYSVCVCVRVYHVRTHSDLGRLSRNEAVEVNTNSSKYFIFRLRIFCFIRKAIGSH